MFMRMMGLVMMMVVCILILIMVVLLLHFFVLVGGAFMDGELDALDGLARLALPMSVEVADPELLEFPFEGGRFYPKVAQCPHGHIAADAREAIEIEYTHRRALFHCLRNFPSALANVPSSAMITDP